MHIRLMDTIYRGIDTGPHRAEVFAVIEPEATGAEMAL
jgi:hypothetical protein